MPYKDKQRTVALTRKWRARMREENKCPRCGAPLQEGESVYCSNCKMHLQRFYPPKYMRGDK